RSYREALDKILDLCYKHGQTLNRWERKPMAFGLVVLSLVLIVLILRGILRLGEAMPVWEGTTPG
uniref:hypothetical protein n=1 Tax=Thermoflexus sp. TaxID=1969742 RepID=UPI0035E3F5A5